MQVRPRPESWNCIFNSFEAIDPIPTAESSAPQYSIIPKIRPPPQSPRRSRPSSTHSTYSLNPEIDLITFDTQPPTHPFRRSSQSLRVSGHAAAIKRSKYQQKGGQLPESTSLVLPLKVKPDLKPIDTAKWKEYVEASFPDIEDKGEIVIKIETKESKAEKASQRTPPQVTKMKQYSKLKQESSIEEAKFSQDDQSGKPNEIKQKEENKAEVSSSLAEKRRRFLHRKQTQSAPDPDSPNREVASTSSGSGTRKTAHLCMGGRCRARGSDSSIQPPSINLDPDVGIEHLDDLKYPDGDAPCHFCERDFSQSIHDEARLKIVSGGLIQTRDGSSSDSPSQYMNLPSPILQCEENNQLSFQQQLDAARNPVKPPPEEDDVLPEGQLPPPSVLIRRKAIASSNLRTDAQRQQLSLDEFARRSSTVVYPEMQICPGDLMVYSKALINSQLVKEKGKKKGQRKFKIDNDIARRRTWSILKIFDRHRKAGSITGLETFLDGVKRDFFDDRCLARYRGMTWSEFCSKTAKERKRKKMGQKMATIAEGKSPYDSDDSSDSSESDASNDKDALIILPEKDSDRISNNDEKDDESHPSDYDDKSDNDETIDAEENSDKVAASRASFRELKSGIFKTTLESKCRSAELNLSVNSEKSKPKLLRALSSQQFTSTALDAARSKIEGARPKEYPKILQRGQSTKKLAASSLSLKPAPKLRRQLSELFKKKDTDEKAVPKQGIPEKQETALMKFQRRLTRTQSERVMGLCRLSSWRRKEKPIIEVPQPTSLALDRQCDDKRREAVWDLYQTDCVFLFDHLTVLKCVFMEPLKSAQVEGFLMFAEPQLLFGNLDDLCRVTRNFCRSFIRLLTKQVGPSGELPTIELLEALFKKNEDGDIMTQAYHSYALNYINALTYLETLRSYEAFNVFEKWCATDKRCRKLQLTDFLVAPVQHIMKIPLLLKEILACTENPSERSAITSILELEEKSLRQLDDKMKWLKNYEHLLELQKNINWPSVLEMDPKLFVPEFIKPALRKQVCDRVILSARRKIINEGPIICWDTGRSREMILILFDDMLLITRKRKKPKTPRPGTIDSLSTPCMCGSVYKQPLSLDRIHLYEPSLVEMVNAKIEHSFLLIVVNRFQQVVTIHTLQAGNQTEKDNWLSLLREAQENFKKNLETTIFRATSPSTPGPSSFEKKLKSREKEVNPEPGPSRETSLTPVQAVKQDEDEKNSTPGDGLAGESRMRNENSEEIASASYLEKKGSRKTSI